MKSKRFIILILSLIFLLSEVSFAAVSVKNVNLRGKNANVVTVDLDKSIKLCTAKPNNMQIGTAPFSSFIASHGAKAAINANYFEAYKGGKYPFGTQMKNGVMVNMEGKNANLVVFDKYKAKILEGTFKYNGYRVCE